MSFAEPLFLSFCPASHHPSVGKIKQEESEREGREHLHIQEKGQTELAASDSKALKEHAIQWYR